MSNDVVLSAALRSNLLSLQNTQRNIDTTQLRLATGLKVNSALDNPQNFFAAQSLNNRAGDLNRLLDGISQSIRTIEEADAGITSLTKLIEQAESVATEAQSEIRAAEGFARVRSTEDLRALGDLVDGTIITATTNQIDITITEEDGTTTSVANIALADGETIDGLVATINSNTTLSPLVEARVTSGGQFELISKEEGALVRITGGTANSVTAAGFARLGLDNLVSTENNVAATRNGGTAVAGREIKSKVSGAAAVNGAYQSSATLGAAGYLANYTTGGADDVELRISVDGQQTVIGQYNGADHTIQSVIDGINNSSIEGVTASFDTEAGRIVLTAADTVGEVSIQFVSEGAGTTDFNFGTGAADGALVATNALSENFSFVGASPDLAQFESDYNNIRDQIDGIVEDASYRGVNLLGGDNLTTFFNEDRDNKLQTEGVDFTALGLGVDKGDFSTSADVQKSLDDIRAALLEVRNFGQSIANDLAIIQTRRDFTEQTINTLEAGADDLTVADQNEEGANLLALQTRQQLGVTSLSLAAQSQQSVLRLF